MEIRIRNLIFILIIVLFISSESYGLFLSGGVWLWNFLHKHNFEMSFYTYTDNYFYSFYDLDKVYDRYKWERIGLGDYKLNKIWYEVSYRFNFCRGVVFNGGFIYQPFENGQDSWDNKYGKKRISCGVEYSVTKYFTIRADYAQEWGKYEYERIYGPWEKNIETWDMYNNLKSNKIINNTYFKVGVTFKP